MRSATVLTRAFVTQQYTASPRSIREDSIATSSRSSAFPVVVVRAAQIYTYAASLFQHLLALPGFCFWCVHKRPFVSEMLQPTILICQVAEHLKEQHLRRGGICASEFPQFGHVRRASQMSQLARFGLRATNGSLHFGTLFHRFYLSKACARDLVCVRIFCLRSFANSTLR